MIMRRAFEAPGAWEARIGSVRSWGGGALVKRLLDRVLD